MVLENSKPSMYIRVYRDPVIRFPLPQTFLQDAENIGAHYAAKTKKPELVKWFQTWYLCARAFTYYYHATDLAGYEAWCPIEQKARASGWPDYELMKINDNVFHVVTCAAREDYSYGHTLSGRVSSGIFNRSKGKIFVLAALDIPDVDIVGWCTREEIVKTLQRGAFYLKEVNCKPMSECPGLARRDNKNWYM